MEREALDIRSIIVEIFALWRRNFGVLFAAAVVAFGPLPAFTYLLMSSYPEYVTDPQQLYTLDRVGQHAIWLLWTIPSTIVMTRVVLNDLAGNPPGSDQHLRSVWQHYKIFALISLIVAPGYLLAAFFSPRNEMFLEFAWSALTASWLLVGPVRLAEKRGLIESFGRSFCLTKRRFGLLLAFTLLVDVLGWALHLMVRPRMFTPDEPYVPVVYWLFEPVIWSIVSIFACVGTAAIYWRLREAEGTERAAHFD